MRSATYVPVKANACFGCVTRVGVGSIMLSQDPFSHS